MSQAATIARANIGERLKELRFNQNLTLSDVSGRTGVSVSTLSKIENHQVSPTFDVIMRISEGLDISLEDFVRTNGGRTQVLGRRTVTLAEGGVSIPTTQYNYRIHATDLVRKHMVPLEIEVLARSIDDFENWGSHPGEEYLYVLQGVVEVHTELYAPARLHQGESAYFDSNMRHAYVSVSKKPARVLSISYDPNLGKGNLDSIVRLEAS